MRRPVLTLLLAAAAGLTSLPANADKYCAAVVPNDSVRDLKSDIVAALKKAGFKSPISAWPASSTKTLEVDADQGTMRLVDDVWGSGLALHATLCTSQTDCDKAKRFFETAGANNYLKRYGTSEGDFEYVDLKTSYKELMKGRPYSLGTSSFEGHDWGSWFALTLSPSPLVGTTKSGKGRPSNTNVSRDLHVSFIKVKYGSKDSANAQNVVAAIREAVTDKTVSIQFDDVKCS